MSLFIDTSSNNGIPNHIYQAIRELEPEFMGNWRVTVISVYGENRWELKITPEYGEPSRADLYPEDQNIQGIQRTLRILRDKVSVVSAQA